MSDSTLSELELATLEAMIDKQGIENLLIALSEICGAKAEHIATNWQDARLAKQWATVEGAIGVAVPHALGL